METTTDPTEKLMCANQIANKMNRTRRAVVINIELLGIQPKMKVGRSLYYDPDTAIPKLEAKMRRQNWNKRIHQPSPQPA